MIEPRRHEDHEVIMKKFDFDILSKEVVDCCFKVHQKMGCGLLEDLYEEPVCIELDKKNIPFIAQKSLPVFYDGKKLRKTLRLDVLIDNQIILELKAVDRLLPVHEAQIITYLKITGVKTGFLINFNEPYFKNAIKRFVL
jgi:GxxExxY protein